MPQPGGYPHAAETSGDLEGYLALFTDDVVLMPPNEPIVVGKDAMRAIVEELFEAFTIDETGTQDEIVIAGDWAFERGTFTQVLTPKAEGEALELAGSYIMLHRRQPDGSWQCSHAIWNSDNPPPEE